MLLQLHVYSCLFLSGLVLAAALGHAINTPAQGASRLAQSRCLVETISLTLAQTEHYGCCRNSRHLQSYLLGLGLSSSHN